jgi:predicted small lipoprotein YifL
MRRTSAALLAVLTLALGAAGCGRNENAQGSPDGQGESLEERKKDTGTTPTE